MLLRTYKSKNMRGWHVGHGRLSGKGTRLDIGGSRLSVSTLLLAELTLGYIEESVMLLEVEYGHSLQEKNIADIHLPARNAIAHLPPHIDITSSRCHLSRVDTTPSFQGHKKTD